MKILFTSIGRRVELIQAFRQAAQKANIDLVIYGADMALDAPALAYCDKTIRLCQIKDEEYIPSLLHVCREEGIQALIPTIDTDLLLLAHSKEQFEKIGTRVIISAEEKIALCRDKRKTPAFFASCGLKTPVLVDNWTKYTGGFPAFIKPRNGSSSINAFKVENEQKLEELAKKVEGYIVQPFINGTEYTVDIFCDFQHKPIFITPRERIAVRSGEVLKTRICQNETIIAECKKLIEKFEPVGQITVQLIQQASTGENYYIEINPRFGGGAPLSIKAGADSAEALLRLLDGQTQRYVAGAAADESVYSRFDQSVCVNFGENAPVKAVIFDLDDTLYAEKTYVKSGFEAVERAHGVSAKALYDAFLEKKPAIDTVLESMGKTELKTACLQTYRTHKPSIALYEGVEELLKELKRRNVIVGVITDGRPEGQRAKLEALGLNNLVDHIIVTDELGGAQFRKPCDIAFRIMQRQCNVDYSQMLYVADNPQKDFRACQQLSMQYLWFKNCDGIYIDSDTQACNCVETVEQLVEFVTNKIV